MRSLLIGLWVTAFLTASMTISASGQSNRAVTTRNKAKAQQKEKLQQTARAANKRGTNNRVGKTTNRNSQQARQGQGCNSCPVLVSARNNSRTAKNSGAVKKSAKSAACHPKGYVDPAIARNYNGAMRDLRRAGIEPKVTSTWRSSAYQARLHRCSNSRRCRRAHPGLYYALPPGASLHEAGFAVDMSGVAIGPRGAKRLTPRGRRIIAIMRKHGFIWRYGLADPAHFEIDPRKHGYRSAQQAIKRNQTQCQSPYIARRDQGSPAKRKESVSRRIVARNR